MSTPKKRIAMVIPERELRKINWDFFKSVCEAHNFELFIFDYNATEKFDILLHKMTELFGAASFGDMDAFIKINQIEKALIRQPYITVIDSITNVRKLLSRTYVYSRIRSSDLNKHGIFVPTFCTLRSPNLELLSRQIQDTAITYPFIAKALLGHMHEMSIIFNPEHLADCPRPCVAQSFVNHDAVIYKIFTVGDKFAIAKRRSLKNFSVTQGVETIHFDSNDISKSYSNSSLSVLDPEDMAVAKVEPIQKKFEIIANSVRKIFGLDLLGIDVFIEKDTQKYFIVDVNAYPGYDGFPDFYNVLLQFIRKKVDGN